MGFYHRRQHSTYRMQRERDRPVMHQHRAEWNIFLGDGVTPTALLVADLDVRIQCRKIRIRIESQVAETSLGVSLWTRVQIIVMDP